jgi:hypothetical protein
MKIVRILDIFSVLWSLRRLRAFLENCKPISFVLTASKPRWRVDGNKKPFLSS